MASGGLTSQPYFLLHFFEISPSIPLLYSWMLTFSTVDALYSFSMIVFLLTVLAIYGIGCRIFSKETAIISALVFISIPAVLITISSRSLYLDMLFVFFFLVTLYSSLKIINFDKSQTKASWIDYSMFFVGISLLLLTRIEFGLFLVPGMLMMLIFIIRPRNWEVFLALSIGIGYYGREIRNIMLFPSSWLNYLQQLTPVIVVSLIFFIILKMFSFSNNKRILPDRKIALVAICIMLASILYLLENTLVSGFIIPGLPLSNSAMSQSIISFDKLTTLSTHAAGINFSGWFTFFSVWWLIPPFLIPFSFSLVTIAIKVKKNVNVRPLLIPILLFFAGLFIIWATLSYDPQPRRLYYFAPFVSFIVGYGLYKIKKYFSPFGFSLRVSIYATSLTILTLTYINAKTVNDVAYYYSQLVKPQFSLEFLAIAGLLFYLIFTPYEKLIHRFRFKKIQIPKKNLIIVLLLSLTFGLFLIPINSIIVGVVQTGYQSRTEYNGAGWLYYPDVVNYYNQNITDNYVTIGFFNHELVTFANRSIIDLSDPTYGIPLYSTLQTSNETQMLNRLTELNVGYFLKPTTNNPYYSMYEKLINNTVFGKIFLDNPQFRAIHTFKNAVLYKFYSNNTGGEAYFDVTPLPCSNIIPWNFDSSQNYSFLIEQNMAKFTGSTNSAGELTLMFTPNSTSSLADAFSMTINSQNSSISLEVTLFSHIQNRTTDSLNFDYRQINGTLKPLLNLNDGNSIGNFDPTHIEGIIIGIKAEPHVIESFEISGLNSIHYTK